MQSNEQIVEELYIAGEGRGLDATKVVSLFSHEGYMWDMASGVKFRGKAIGDSIADLAKAFPDVHREMVDVHIAGNVVIVETAIRGTHKGDLPLASGTLAPTGRSIDVPSCDVFYFEGGKITAFHCYNEASVMQRQLGINPG